MSRRGRYLTHSSRSGPSARIAEVPIMKTLAQITSEELAALRAERQRAILSAKYRKRLTFDPDEEL